MRMESNNYYVNLMTVPEKSIDITVVPACVFVESRTEGNPNCNR